MRYYCGKSLQPILLSVGLFSKFENPRVHDRVKTEGEEDEANLGWKRLKEMYSYDKYGSLSPQFALILEGTMFSFFTGLMLGGVGDSKEAYIKFIEENQATAYLHHLEAKRKLQDQVMKSFFRGGWRVGWRLSLVTTSVLVIVTSINTYREQSSILEFAVGGAMTCGLYKFKQGPKPAIAGTVLGAGLGTLAGGCVLGLMKVTGVTFRDIYKLDADRIQKQREKDEKKLHAIRNDKLSKMLPYRREMTEDANQTMEESQETSKCTENVTKESDTKEI